MTLAGLLAAVASDEAVAEAVRRARATGTAGATAALDLAAPDALQPLLVAALAAPSAGGPSGARGHRHRPRGRGPAPRRCARCCRRTRSPTSPPGRRCRTSGCRPRSDTVGRRLAVLRRLAHPSADDPATGPLRGRGRPGPRRCCSRRSRGLGDLEPVALRAGRRAPTSRTSSRGWSTRRTPASTWSRSAASSPCAAASSTSSRRPRSTRCGSSSGATTVEEIRCFAVADQRIARDRPSTACGRRRAASCCSPTTVRDARPRLADEHPELAEMLDKLAEGIAVEGMESLAPVLVDEMELLRRRAARPAPTCWSATPSGSAPAPHDLVAHQRRSSSSASWASGRRRRRGADRPRRRVATASLADVRAARAASAACRGGRSAPFARRRRSSATRAPTTVEQLGVPAPRRGATAATPTRAVADVARLARATAGAVVLRHRGPRPGRSACVEVLARARTSPPGWSSRRRRPRPSPASSHVTTRPRSSTASSTPALGLAVLTETDLTGQRGRPPRTCAGCRRGAATPSTRSQLQAGDFVVHEQHGVGRYVEMVQRTVGGATREYLVLEYAPSQARPARRPALRADRPARPGDPLRRRRGARAAPARRRRLGEDQGPGPQGGPRDRRRADPALRGAAWPRRATRSARTRPWQRELEDAFPYAETPDQLAAIDEVKADMERPVPMDRLICGDVGYGKTEIAVRAAFKAVQDGKQVAVLVPTTLLVQQHLVDVRRAVRAASRSTVEAAVAVPDRQGGRARSSRGLRRRHRRHRHRHPPAARPPTSRFKDLGLVIVDEEQRFGVEHKEQLKQLRTDVDVLTMTATPIPRTLEMAVTGIREMSTIADPAGGAAPGAHLRRRLRREAGRRGDPARAAARGPGLLRPQPGRVDRPGRGPAARAGARGAGRDRARPDGRAPARAGHASTSGRSSSTSSSARRSSSPASTSPTPTR